MIRFSRSFLFVSLEGSGLGYAGNRVRDYFKGNTVFLNIAMIFSFSGLQSENTSLKVENVDLTGE